MAQQQFTNIQELLQLVAKHFGYQVGAKVKTEIEKVIEAENVDIKKLQDAIDVIQKLLDADPDTPEFDVGQNIITQLTDHLNRIKKLEGQVATLNADENTEGSVDYKVKQAKDELQAEIDKLKGDSDESLSSLKSEIDAIEAGAGLDENGNYVKDKNANYIKDATSIHHATQILDSKLKEISDKEEADKQALEAEITSKTQEAEANAKAYTDEQIKAQLNVDVCAIADLFAKAIDCGLEGKTQADCASDCSQGSASGSASGNGSGNASASGSASGDGAVL